MFAARVYSGEEGLAESALSRFSSDLHAGRENPNSIGSPLSASAADKGSRPQLWLGVKEGKRMLIWIVAGVLLCTALGFVATEFRSHHR